MGLINLFLKKKSGKVVHMNVPRQYLDELEREIINVEKAINKCHDLPGSSLNTISGWREILEGGRGDAFGGLVNLLSLIAEIRDGLVNMASLLSVKNFDAFETMELDLSPKIERCLNISKRIGSQIVPNKSNLFKTTDSNMQFALEHYWSATIAADKHFKEIRKLKSTEYLKSA